MKNKSPYPKHIYEQIRVEIALVYLKRQMRKMLSDRRPRAFQLKEFFQKSENQKLAQYWQEEFAKHAQASEPRDSFPIIAMEEEDKGQKIFSIYDGNRRLVLAVLQGKTTISTYVGEYRTSKKTPQNFWLPTSFLMEFVKGAELMQTKENYPHILSTLQGLIKLSESGGYELKERVLIGKNEFRMRLRNDLGWN